MVLVFYARYPNSTSINHSLLKLIVFVSTLLKFSNKFLIVLKYKKNFSKKKSLNPFSMIVLYNIRLKGITAVQ